MTAYFDIDTQIYFVFPAGELYGAGAAATLLADCTKQAIIEKDDLDLFSNPAALPLTRATAHLSDIEGERTIRDFIAAGGQCV